MQSRKLGAGAYNKDGSLKVSSRKPRSYDEVTRIRRERDLRKDLDAKFRQGTIKGLDIAAKVPDVLPWAPTPLAAASAVYKNWAPKGSEYYNPDASVANRVIGTSRDLVDVAVAHNVGKFYKNPVLGFFSGMASSKMRLPSAAKGGISRGGLTRVHNKELVVPRKKVGSLIKLMKRSGVALPLSAIRAKAKAFKK